MKRLEIAALLLGLSLSGVACVKESKTTSPAKEGAAPLATDAKPTVPAAPVTPEKLKTKGPSSRELCVRPAAIKNPETIEDVIRLVNAMPKPVSVPCLIDTFDTPFRINATDNMFSGQPANGFESPRIFLFMGKSLIVSVVPSGQGASIVEFGYKISDHETIKGELEFPVTAELPLDAAYTHILNRSKDGTLCGSCHFPETPAPEGFPATAFVSAYVKAMEDYDVSVKNMEDVNKQCETTLADHCPVIQSLFIRGKVIPEEF